MGGKSKLKIPLLFPWNILQQWGEQEFDVFRSSSLCSSVWFSCASCQRHSKRKIVWVRALDVWRAKEQTMLFGGSGQSFCHSTRFFYNTIQVYTLKRQQLTLLQPSIGFAFLQRVPYILKRLLPLSGIIENSESEAFATDKEIKMTRINSSLCRIRILLA